MHSYLNFHSFTQTLVLTDSHSHTLTHLHSLSLSLSHSHSYTHSYTHSHSHSHIHSFSLLAFTLTHSHSHAYTLTLTHSNFHALVSIHNSIKKNKKKTRHLHPYFLKVIFPLKTYAKYSVVTLGPNKLFNPGLLSSTAVRTCMCACMQVNINMR